jgi:hypothetical protein
MGVAKPLSAFSADFDPGLVKQLVGEQAPAHADLAMDAPDRQFDTLRIKRPLPCKDVLIDAVNERAVEIEQSRFDTHFECSSMAATATIAPAFDEIANSRGHHVLPCK